METMMPMYTQRETEMADTRERPRSRRRTSTKERKSIHFFKLERVSERGCIEEKRWKGQGESSQTVTTDKIKMRLTFRR